jgi:hypothetical protein
MKESRKLELDHHRVEEPLIESSSGSFGIRTRWRLRWYGDPDQKCFSDGMVEDIHHDRARQFHGPTALADRSGAAGSL